MVICVIILTEFSVTSVQGVATMLKCDMIETIKEIDYKCLFIDQLMFKELSRKRQVSEKYFVFASF